MKRGVVANLDAEAVLAGRSLPEPVKHRISAAGTLLRVGAEPDEPLWTPLAVDPGRVLPVEGLSTPTLVSGGSARPSAPRLSWCTADDPQLLSRRSGDDCARASGERLSGTHWIDGVHELVQRLREPPHASGGAWILKPAGAAAVSGMGRRCRARRRSLRCSSRSRSTGRC